MESLPLQTRGFPHHLIHHGGEGEPSFHLRPVRFTQTALTRQILEAVLVQRWGEEKLLNSKAEFNRSKISRLTLGEDEKRIMRPEIPPDLGEEEGDQPGDSGGVQDWAEDRSKDRRAQEIRSITSWERGLFKSPARKRLGEEELPRPASPAKKSKWKYPPLALAWGEEESPSVSPCPMPSSPQPQPEQKSLGEETKPRSPPQTITNQPVDEETLPPPTSMGTTSPRSLLNQPDQSSAPTEETPLFPPPLPPLNPPEPTLTTEVGQPPTHPPSPTHTIMSPPQTLSTKTTPAVKMIKPPPPILKI